MLGHGADAGALQGQGDLLAEELGHLGLRLIQATVDVDRVGIHEVLETLEGGANHVVGVGGTEALGEHVVDAGGFHDGADRGAGDDAGALGSGLHEDRTGAEAAGDGMGQAAVGRRRER